MMGARWDIIGAGFKPRVASHGCCHIWTKDLANKGYLSFLFWKQALLSQTKVNTSLLGMLNSAHLD